MADAVAVDMSGDAGVLLAVHDWLGDHLKYSMIIGKSHHDALPVEISMGPTPQFFFAPAEVSRRRADWGVEEYERRCTEALEAFVAGSERWLTVERTTGSAAAEDTWHDVFDGRVAPAIGRTVSMHD